MRECKGHNDAETFEERTIITRIMSSSGSEPTTYKQFLPLPTSYFKMFWKDSLMIPITPLQASFTITPSHPIPLPPPIKVLIVYHALSI